MPHYKSFRKKNRYKTLKYSHKNKRKNSHKNKYRVGRGPLKWPKHSRLSRLSSRARTHQAPPPRARPPPLAEPIDDAMVARMYTFLAEEERRLQREEEAPPPLPLTAPPRARPPPWAEPGRWQTFLAEEERRLQREEEREMRIESLLEETRDLINQLELDTDLRITTNHDRFLYIEAVLPTLRDRTHDLMTKLESPDIIHDYRITNARDDLFFKLDTTARNVATIRYAMDMRESRRIRG